MSASSSHRREKNIRIFTSCCILTGGFVIGVFMRPSAQQPPVDPGIVLVFLPEYVLPSTITTFNHPNIFMIKSTRL